MPAAQFSVSKYQLMPQTGNGGGEDGGQRQADLESSAERRRQPNSAEARSTGIENRRGAVSRGAGAVRDSRQAAPAAPAR